MGGDIRVNALLWKGPKAISFGQQFVFLARNYCEDNAPRDRASSIRRNSSALLRTARFVMADGGWMPKIFGQSSGGVSFNMLIVHASARLTSRRSVRSLL